MQVAEEKNGTEKINASAVLQRRCVGSSFGLVPFTDGEGTIRIDGNDSVKILQVILVDVV